MKKIGILQEFKAFISKGNVMDLAVGIIIGSAFTAIVNALVNDIIMPFVGLVIGKVNFTELKWILVPANGTAPEVAILYGSFIQSIINFLIIGFVIFMIVKFINKINKPKVQDATPPAPSAEVVLLQEIVDQLKKNAQ